MSIFSQQYGDSILTNGSYQNIYSTLGLIEQYTQYTLYGNNAYFGSNITANVTSTRLNRVDNSSTNCHYVSSGLNEYTLETYGNTDHWIRVAVKASGYTTSVYFGQFKLRFEDDSLLSINEAISSGYIAPLCLIHSYRESYAWQNIMDIIDGTSNTNSKNYPAGYIYLRPLISRLKGVSLYANKAFNTSYDGLRIYEYESQFDLSIVPFEDLQTEKYLIFDNGNYKRNNAGVWETVSTQTPATEQELEQLFLTYGNDELTEYINRTGLEDDAPQIMMYTDNLELNSITIRENIILKAKLLTKTQSMTINGLGSMEVDEIKSGDGIINFVFSIDNGVTWYTYNFNLVQWETITLTVANVETKGLSSENVMNISMAEYELLFSQATQITFSVLIKKVNYDDEAILKKIRFNFKNAIN